MADVTLDISNFREHYPKFTEEKVTDTQIEDAWQFACSMCGSTDKDSRLPYMPKAEPPVYTRKIALYLIMCHVLTIDGWGGGQAGAIQSASQGSVSTSFQLLQGKTTSESWWLQTTCGARYWQMIKPLLMGGRFYFGNNFHPWG